MSIISISGKINSGKDTVGKIIKILTASPHFNNQAVLDFLKRDLYTSGWEIKKFADKLKDIVCLLLGCTREQLEDREFKEKELGPEWDRIIASDGKIYLPDEYPDLEYSKLTPRLLLQLLGTECGRNIIHPNIWVNALMSEYQPYQLLISKIRRKGFGISPQKLEESLPNWIITDTRFPNELKAVKDRGGITIRVNRNPEGKWIDKQEWDLHTKGIVSHKSETALDNADFDYVIDNNSDIQSLIEKIKEILIKENLL